tara:strand:- start:1287 stop:2003 length:717 start_codon:yes stop_codon:yes gene_type:complete
MSEISTRPESNSDEYGLLTYSMVLCIYNENIDWIWKYKNTNIRNYKFQKIFLYIKNRERYEKLIEEKHDELFEIISLPNVGSNDYVYLHHIINNYDNLTDCIEFRKGSGYRYPSNYNMNIFTREIPDDIANFYLDNWDFSYNKNLNFKYEKSGFKNVRHYLLSLFKESAVNKLFDGFNYVLYFGNFSVTRDNILRYPKMVYEKLHCLEGGPNREIDHYQERIWGLLFSNKYKKINFEE